MDEGGMAMKRRGVVAGLLLGVGLFYFLGVAVGGISVGLLWGLVLWI